MQEASFDTITFHLLDSGFLSPDSMTNLIKSHTAPEELHASMINLTAYDFWWLKDSNLQWATQTEIDPNKPIMRFLGGNYIVTHQDVEDIIKGILPYVDYNLVSFF